MYTSRLETESEDSNPGSNRVALPSVQYHTTQYDV